MFVSKVNIENFKCYKGKFSLALNPGTNILVGNNEAGKSTILEAIHLGLSGVLNGRYARYELTQYLFNRQVEQDYINSLAAGNPISPPRILIEIFFGGESASLAELQGNGNSERSDSSGVSFVVEFNDDYRGEYEQLLLSHSIKTIPIEYYHVQWSSFARESITSRSVPVKSAFIDSSSARVINGSDVYVSRIIRDNLEEKERVEISQAHRFMKESFMDTASVQAINGKINSGANLTGKKIKISVDLATQNAWELSLMTYLDDIPFHFIGKGEQSIVKTNLALSHKKSKEASVVLLEEPENHLSHSKLSELILRITEHIGYKQIILSTHSSFVANKLGLDHLILLNDLKCMRLNELKKETKDFFLKLAGYDTLRLILCKRAILVEGDSDELIVQKAYMQMNNGRLPIQDGVDVISVGTSFLRFLEIAKKINKKVSVVTDNDSDVVALEGKYHEYLGVNSSHGVKICYDKTVDTGTMIDFNYNTLEPKMLKSNSVDFFNQVLGKSYNEEELLKFMFSNKTSCALKIFDTSEQVVFPLYITEAISN